MPLPWVAKYNKHQQFRLQDLTGAESDANILHISIVKQRFTIIFRWMNLCEDIKSRTVLTYT
jgi:hypothetical protein